MRVERPCAWEDKYKRLLRRFACLQQQHDGMQLMAYTLIHLRRFGGTSHLSPALSLPPEPHGSHTSLPSFTRWRTSPCLACLEAVCSRFFSCATATAHGWQNRPSFDGERVGSNRWVA